MIEQYIWYRKYIPQNISEYVFKNESYKALIEKYISEQEIPHLLLYGPAGTGKSSIANVLINELNINSGDIFRRNVSSETGIDMIRDELTPFVSTYPFGKYKVVILEEFERMSMGGQKSLKLIIEDFSQQARFILTTNHINNVLPEIKSRMKELFIDKIDYESYILKGAEILTKENISFEPDILVKYCNLYYPDLRKLINNLQNNIIDNVLLDPLESENTTNDFEIEVSKLLKTKNILEIRKYLCSHISVNQAVDFYRFLYRNLNIWSDTQEGQNEAIILIAKGLNEHTTTADWEINLASIIIQLAKINK